MAVRYSDFTIHLFGKRVLSYFTIRSLQWIAQLNFDKGDELSWENVDSSLPRTEKLASMVKRGIPHSLRHQLWMRFAGKSVFKLIIVVHVEIRIFKSPCIYYRYLSEARTG